MYEPPKSKQFDDVYFSAQDGLAETRHVFLDGNDLPRRWLERKSYTICETGFGTGLNFFSAWKLFDETAGMSGDARLEFISIEKYPLSAGEILSGLAPWLDYFGGRVERFCAHYPPHIPGFHRIQIDENIGLTLIFDDVNDALPALEADVDCWFLDGFRPASNPDMWSEVLYVQMARLSVDGASVATFTAAGHVRRGLQAAGFDIQKVAGFGRKREMVIGQYRPNHCNE